MAEHRRLRLRLRIAPQPHPHPKSAPNHAIDDDASYISCGGRSRSSGGFTRPLHAGERAADAYASRRRFKRRRPPYPILARASPGQRPPKVRAATRRAASRARNRAPRHSVPCPRPRAPPQKKPVPAMKKKKNEKQTNSHIRRPAAAAATTGVGAAPVVRGRPRGLRIGVRVEALVGVGGGACRRAGAGAGARQGGKGGAQEGGACTAGGAAAVERRGVRGMEVIAQV
ncbi:hypothetical protein C8J57DRAFT_1258135 [Mycena rebaudengoi]|nr:hypothetical protein C8J57DRAFT_1258135 [Mycena rebaudengoi]